MRNSLTKQRLIWFAYSIIFSVCSYAQDTTKLYFRLDDSQLNTATKSQIDELIYYDKINSNSDILIVGYADLLGSSDYNKILSTKRAENVKYYLLNMGIPETHIKLCIGKGEIFRTREIKGGYAADRRVDIVNLKGKKGPPTKKIRNKEKPLPTLSQTSKEAIRFDEIKEFDMIDLPVGQLILLNRIYFHTGRHVVKDGSYPELNKLYRLLKANPGLKINIEGHVCCVHPTVDALDMDTGEHALSVNRAKYIYYYLIKKGIDKERLSYEGFGKSRPLRETEFTWEDQDMNKRVEIRILKK